MTRLVACLILAAALALAPGLAPAMAKDPPPASQPPAPTTKIAAAGILGRNVAGPDGKVIGRVVDVLVDAGSNPRAAVIDFGGFLGVGTRRVAVNWSDLTFPPTGTDTDIKLDLTATRSAARRPIPTRPSPLPSCSRRRFKPPRRPWQPPSKRRAEMAR
jgi:hypothetical protein